MSQQVSLKASMRDATGKESCKKLRKQGITPGVFYNNKGDNLSLQFESIPLMQTYSKARTNIVVELQIEDGKKVKKIPSLIKDIVFHPTKPMVQHVDFFGINLEQELKVNVPVQVEGTPAGVKEGGIFSTYRDVIEVSCLPQDIPEAIVIDVAALNIGDTIHIEDLEMPKGVKALFEENYSVVGVTVPAAEEPEVEEEELAEGEEAEGAEAAEDSEDSEEASEE